MSNTQEVTEDLVYMIKQLCNGFTTQVVVSALCHVMLDATNSCEEHVTKERFLEEVAKSWDWYHKDD